MKFSPIFLIFTTFFGIALGLTAAVFLDGGLSTGAFNLFLIISVVILGGILSRTWPAQEKRVRESGVKTIPLFFEITMAVFGVLLLGHVLGDGDGSLGLEFYRSFDGYDTALHVIAGIAVGASALCVYLPPRPMPLVLIALGGAFVVGILWEVFEIAIDQFFALHLWRGFDDTALDLAADGLGGLVTGLATLWYFVRNQK